MSQQDQYRLKIRQIVSAFREIKPKRIVLFGSTAKKTIHADSDIDVCVITETDNSLKTKRELQTKLWEHRVGFTPEIDIHVFPPKIYTDYKQRKDPFVEEIEKGIVLYEQGSL